MSDINLSRRAMLSGAVVTAAGVAATQAAAQDAVEAAPAGLPGAGRAALITGSSRGIGAATARRLAADGYAVTVNCLNNTDLAAGVVSEIEAAGGRDIRVLARTAHTIGTCRMGTDPATAVVDPDGRSFDVPNLWIADNSVFPTSMPANPALTIMALGLRTAEKMLAAA